MSDERRDDMKGARSTETATVTAQTKTTTSPATTKDDIDALISAGLDDALSQEARAELDGLLAQDAIASRSQDFEDVDAALRSLAEDSMSEADLSASLETLREKMDWSEAPAADARVVPLRKPGLRLGLSAGLAAAAAALLFFAVGGGEKAGFPGEETVTEAEGTVSRVEVANESGPEVDEIMTALGYGEWSGDFSELGLASPEDLEIVEQLELLDFLATREAGGRG